MFLLLSSLIDPQDLNVCGCSKVTIDGVSDMLYERQDALEALQNPEENTGEVSAIDRYRAFDGKF